MVVAFIHSLKATIFLKSTKFKKGHIHKNFFKNSSLVTIAYNNLKYNAL